MRLSALRRFETKFPISSTYRQNIPKYFGINTPPYMYTLDLNGIYEFKMLPYLPKGAKIHEIHVNTSPRENLITTF